MSIYKEIEVTRKRLDVCIDFVYGTDILPIDLKVTDYTIPEGATAVAYNQGKSADVHKQVCSIKDDIISFTPEKGFFEEGRNELQLRVVHNNRSLFTFKCRVECQGSFAESDAEEVKRNSSLVEQLMTEQAVTKARLEEVLKLPEDGSDVEKAVNDIKVGADGKVYSSPGEAVRQQIGQVSEQIDNVKDNSFWGKSVFSKQTATVGENFYKYDSIKFDLSAYSGDTVRIYIEANENIAPNGFRILTNNGKSPTIENRQRYLANTEYIIDSLYSEFAESASNGFGLFATADDIKASGDVTLWIYYDYPNSEAYKFNEELKMLKESHPWRNKKIVFYGDSITALGGYVNYVQSKTECEAINMGIGGTLITYINENSFSSDSRIETIPADADAVIIMGGTNDWEWAVIESDLIYNDGFDRTKFKGALAYTIKAIQERCPNAMVIVATNIGGRGESAGVIQPLPIIATNANGGNGVGNTPLKIRNAEIEVANMLNVPVCDTWSCGINGFNRTRYISDNVHPTDEGFELMGKYIVDFLETHTPIN